MDDTLAFYGGAVKALGGGKVGGYIILYSGPNDPDLERDYFTKDTDFFIEDGEQRPILYRHGTHPQVKSLKLGKAKLTFDEQGIYAEGELADFLPGEKDLRKRYLKLIQKMAADGDLGWSSGSMSHLVEKKQVGKSFEILAWPIGEASLTPIPVEGRTSAFPLKELPEPRIDFDAVIKSLEQEEFDHAFSIDGVPSIKAYGAAVAPTSLADGEHTSRAMANAVKEFTTVAKLLGESLFSDATRLVRRTENRFLKQSREIDPSTVKQSKEMLDTLKLIEPAFQSIKDGIEGIIRISEMSVTEQRAINEKARLAMWNFCRISGTLPEELEK